MLSSVSYTYCCLQLCLCVWSSGLTTAEMIVGGVNPTALLLLHVTTSFISTFNITYRDTKPVGFGPSSRNVHSNYIRKG